MKNTITLVYIKARNVGNVNRVADVWRYEKTQHTNRAKSTAMCISIKDAGNEKMNPSDFLYRNEHRKKWLTFMWVRKPMGSGAIGRRRGGWWGSGGVGGRWTQTAGQKCTHEGGRSVPYKSTAWEKENTSVKKRTYRQYRHNYQMTKFFKNYEVDSSSQLL